jgi:hypothetical protein
VIQGLYYPIYLAFVVVVAKNALTSKRQGEAKIWLGLYGVFLFSMLLGVLRNQSLQIDFMTSQLMFIYCLGLLAFFQFRSERGWRAISLTMAFVSMLVSLWVVFTFSTTPGYEVYRGGVIVNANYISTIIMIGVLVIAGLLVKKIGLWRLAMAIPAILLCFYSMTLLASRGMSIAFLIGIAVIYGTNSGRAKTWFYLLCLAVVVLVVLPRLPGSDSLMNRFGGSDVGTLNERMIIWRGLWEALGNGSFLDLLLGSGFRASEDIVASVTGGNLTSTHNGYLRILVDQGVMGLSEFFGFGDGRFPVLDRFWCRCVASVWRNQVQRVACRSGIFI